MARKKAQPLGLTISPGAIGPNMVELARLASEAEMLHSSASVNTGKKSRISVGITKSDGQVHTVSWRETPEEAVDDWRTAISFDQGMLDLAKTCSQGELHLDSIGVKARGCSLKPPRLLRLAIMAWCEAFGVPVPTEESLAEKERERKVGLREIHDEMLEDLRNGLAGVKKWNARTQKVRARVGHFRDLDLSGQVLAGINLNGLDFQQSNFDRALLRSARLKETDFRHSSFKGAKLDGADLTWAKLAHTDFSGASLIGSKLWGIKNLVGGNFQGADLEKARLVMCDLRNLNLQRANLTRADLSYCHLQGADFSGANLQGAKLTHAFFDETTRVPEGFVLPKGLNWRGKKGSDPRQQRE